MNPDEYGKNVATFTVDGTALSVSRMTLLRNKLYIPCSRHPPRPTTGQRLIPLIPPRLLKGWRGGRGVMTVLHC